MVESKLTFARPRNGSKRKPGSMKKVTIALAIAGAVFLGGQVQAHSASDSPVEATCANCKWAM